MTQAAATSQPSITEQEAYEIGIEAYTYLFPLLLMNITRRITTNLEPGQKPGLGPMNQFNHFRAYPTADFRTVVRPNFDTLYSSAWLDLTAEPMIVSAPDTEERYYMLPMMSMWTDVFAVPGKRTTGTAAASWAVVPPGWTGQLPAGVDRIDSPTAYIWIIGRTQTNGPKDYDAVHRVQDGYSVTPLSQWGKPAQPVQFVSDPTVDMVTDPMEQIKTMPAAQYFSYGAELMGLNPPQITDWSQIARLKRIGIEPGQSFNAQAATPEVQQGLERATADGLKLLKQKAPTIARVVNGWQMNIDTMGVYGNFYLKRAIIALVGLGANQPDDAIYPINVGDADGQPLDGAQKYLLHFDKAELPPVDAFWSVTMYDAQGYQVANPINRFAIGDRDDLTYNPDGSLDLYIQHESPDADKESNWLPSPAEGTLGVTMRLYAPRAEIRNGLWAPPAIKRVS